MTMRLFLSVFLLAATFGFMLMPTACTSTADPGHEQLVVTAESQLKTAVDTFQAVTQVDRDNLEFMKANLPQVHEAIQELRRDFWVKYYDPAQAAVRLYKQTRLPPDGEAQEDALLKLADAVRRARQALLQTQAVLRPPA